MLQNVHHRHGVEATIEQRFRTTFGRAGVDGVSATAGHAHRLGIGIDADDVLLALQLGPRAGSSSAVPELRSRPAPADIAVYRVLERQPLTLDGVAEASTMSLVEAAMSLARLSAAGWVASADGWFECVGSPLS